MVYAVYCFWKWDQWYNLPLGRGRIRISFLIFSLEKDFLGAFSPASYVDLTNNEGKESVALLKIWLKGSIFPFIQISSCQKKHEWHFIPNGLIPKAVDKHTA